MDQSILSIKIVSVDYYNCFPIKKLDSDYSEFRRSPVKSVPVIRIFGITQNKTKICANVHGVFPYFYIPCAETNHEKICQLMENLATTIDRSINISFGQSTSTGQHIFRISLVKGTPYYGFHSAEHQFLRIQLYNPNLLRRVSNLLQSGTILGKQFQPHESHIPYILKFFIDYNLFGMSYLHVPAHEVHTRLADDKSRFKKRSVSQLEVDFKAIHILNRFAATEEDSGKAANPGIESIWEDERLRRSVMDPETVPPLESMVSQVRNCPATESDVFYQTILKKKLAERSNESTLSMTMMSEGSSESPAPKKRFNLKNLLDASTYAAEFSQYSSQSSDAKQSLNESVASQTIEELEHQFMNFSESPDDPTLNSQEILKQLEEHQESDSLLAPLTQMPQSSMTDLNKTLKALVADDNFDGLLLDSSDDDDEMFNELNETVADMEVFSQYVSDDVIPQLDGVDDELETLSPSEITKQNDEKKNFHPQPGPSRLFIPSIKPESPSQSTNILNSQDIQHNLRQLADQFRNSTEGFAAKASPTYDSDFGEDDEDDLISSFYNQTIMIDDEDVIEISDESSDVDMKLEIEAKKKIEVKTGDDVKVKDDVRVKDVDRLHADDDVTCLITPASEPPDPLDVLRHLQDFNIPQHVHPVPFYSNPKDVTGKKEVGYNTLEITGKRLCDLEAFKGSLRSHVDGKKIAKKIKSAGVDVICLHKDPPTYHDAVKWLTESVEKTPQAEDDSPVKEKLGRTLMVLDVDDEDDLDATLVPATPPTPSDNEIIQSSQEKDKSTLSEYREDGISQLFKSGRKRRRMQQSFSKRFQEIMKSKAASAMDSEADSSAVSEEVLRASQSSEGSCRSSDQSSVIVQNANIQEDVSFNNSELTGPTLNNTYGFKMKLESLQSNDEHTDLTILAMELHTQTRNDLKPNPELDAICAIFYSLDGFHCNGELKNLNGIIACVSDKSFQYVKQGVELLLVKSEMDIFEAFFKKIREFDPDIFAGYEIEMASWGYFVRRGYVLEMNLNNALSRMPTEKAEKLPRVEEEEDHNDMGDYHSEQKIPGRIMLDVWRLMRHEIALTSYSFENVCYHVLHRRYPKHTFNFLTSQWSHPLRSWIVFDYYMERARTLIEILKQLDLIGRTCELAKLFGIQFYEVLSRGSQFRVESMMIRIAKRRNYVPVSPSVQQRTHMRAPEYIALILEPESRFYSDPVIVLDFQSLYPSIIIAYNYCFSTCLGRVEHLIKASSQPFEFGAYQLRISPSRLQKFLDDDLVTVSPCGVAYVKLSVKEGVLPRMLREILDTRLMVKQSMKIHKSNSALQRVLHSRQLGLKLIANVTYGYTAANFSGRMPAIEVGDSVVSKGRETLERAIRLVESNKEWGCRVCYGDTDSMFVLVPGRSREDAFKIGEKIAEAVTNDNPHPIKLKLEKVYQPCILQTKKRYVGYMYETADQKEPVYEAKGIETVRRDGCPAAAKMLEKTLRILFETCDVSKVKEYVSRQFTKILTGRCSPQDLIFAKEFRGVTGYKEKACVPALTLTRKFMFADPRNEPRRGERVPFLVVNGAPGLPLIRLVKTPLEVLQDENYKINSIYYITKAIIPPLNRCLLLIGANAFDWFAELPRRQQFIPLISAAASTSTRKGTISQFFSTSNCATCDRQCHESICKDCKNDSQKTVLTLTEKIMKLEQKSAAIQSICESCCKRSFGTACISLDCPVLYASIKAKRDHKQIEFFRDILDEF